MTAMEQNPGETKTSDLPAQTTPTASESPALAEELPELEPSQPVANITDFGINLYSQAGQLILQLPPEMPGDWEAVWQQLQLHLQARSPFWSPQTHMEVRVGNRLLDQRQLQQLAEAFHPVHINVQRICTSRRQTAIAAATLGYSVEQTLFIPPFPDSEASPTEAAPTASPLYLQTTLRSGNEICHAGSVILVGDLNPGSTIIAGGDILVWGRIRGVVHAGAGGNLSARIMGLYLAATQLRIADLIARSPTPPKGFYPEVAYATPNGIQIAPVGHLHLA
ncbi:septum site-determining protein MinC [Synechococcus sp. PCC 6312]|uniref:septum site-determining protein MinC n=1 Tax=Synechococcus sp. (strain ATCC 27167 / PCC 6312) TaxID=195253 RepID=UPI00029F1077|nr:septum site-determining protein MinC [Synechococcus sp. PCC 6312]AFY62722.1 septum formation inhibitor [Synechococcus sp. PCC 6312]